MISKFGSLYGCSISTYALKIGLKQKMQNSSPNTAISPKGIRKLSFRRSSSKHIQTGNEQHSLPAIFPEKTNKMKSLKQSGGVVSGADPIKVKAIEHQIDIGDEKTDLLGYEFFSGSLALYKKSKTKYTDEQKSLETGNSDSIDAKLTSKALAWGSHVLHLEDVISVSYYSGLRYFTLHAYPSTSSRLSCFSKPHRTRRDFCFLAPSSDEAVQWVRSFADQKCYINLFPHPMVSGKKQASDFVLGEHLCDISYIKRKSPPNVLIILNPRSGHGRSSKVFHDKVEPIFKLAGFIMEVVKTTYAGHARDLARTVDFSMCPDGIICVGGDGIVNEVLNGLLSRDDQKAAISIPIGIIPAGSDNSLVWTVLGVRDPIAAAMTIVKGGLTPMDVLAVEWLQTGDVRYGTTVSYFGFLGDVLELSEKYQKRFGPLRYFVAGFLSFLCLPKYTFDLEYLPIPNELQNSEGKPLEDEEKFEISNIYTDAMGRSRSIQRASSFSNINSIMTPSRMSGGDVETSGSMVASSERFDYSRDFDAKSKRSSSEKSNLVTELDEVVHTQPPASTKSKWPRTRSKSKTDKTWSGLTVKTDSKGSWAATWHDKEDISSTVSDPGPVWDSEPKWDTEPNCENEKPIELPGPPDDIEQGPVKELVPSLEDKWVVKKGQFLGILVCNHSCRTVQSLSSQVVAPKAVYDDNSLDLLLVNGSGRIKLLRFFLLLQFGRHINLPYVDYIKVRSVKLRCGTNTHDGCGIDGELVRVKGQVMSSLLPYQCRLIGHPARDHLSKH